MLNSHFYNRNHLILLDWDRVFGLLIEKYIKAGTKECVTTFKIYFTLTYMQAPYDTVGQSLFLRLSLLICAPHLYRK